MLDAPELAWQGSLLGAGRPQADPGFRGSRRHHLSDGAWVDHVPGWLSGADSLFADLLDRLDWQARELPMYGQLVPQPRLSAFWSLDDEAVRYPLLAQLAVVLGSRYGVRFESVGANLYRDGQDSVAFHGDRHARDVGDADVVIPVLSLGAPRRFLLRPRTGGTSKVFLPGRATCW
jgi:alkylated DNA repair dioxygenase AlkB